MTGRRLQITHRTGYRYSDVVDASFNEVRMTPLTGGGQVLVHHSLEIHPIGTIHPYIDYWGAHVESFDVHVPHRVLEIISTSTVDTAPEAPRTASLTWSDLQAPDVRDDFAEFLTPTTYVDLHRAEDCRTLVEQVRGGADPDEGAAIAVASVREHIEYEAGATDVTTTAQQAWAAGRGVCQDFTHTTLSLLRAAGVPARYVSGYLHSEEEAIGHTVTGESHAWVEYWNGEWRAIDPTNTRAVGDAHVVVARGRDYADVPPLKGLYAGGQSEVLGVTVEITQL